MSETSQSKYCILSAVSVLTKKLIVASFSLTLKTKNPKRASHVALFTFRYPPYFSACYWIYTALALLAFRLLVLACF